MKIVLFLVFMSFLIYSCQDSNESLLNERYNESNITLDEELDPTSGFEFTSELDLTNAIGPVEYGAGFKIFSIRRKSNGCKKFGICEWFPKNAEEPIDPWEVGRTVASLIAYDSLNNIIPINFIFTEFPIGLTSEDLKFGIDEDFVMAVTPQMNLPFDSLKIYADTLSFNSNLGSYGGYTVNVVGINNN